MSRGPQSGLAAPAVPRAGGADASGAFSPPGTIHLNVSSGCTVTIAALLCSACAAHRAPTLAVEASLESIARAQAANADRLAPDEMGRAREKFALAARWMAVRDYEPARWLAEQAEVDAELARTRSDAARAVSDAQLLDGRRLPITVSIGGW
jgi:hypothetical protein